MLALVPSLLLAQNARSILYTTWLVRGGVIAFDGHSMDHMMKFPRFSPSILAYCKRSKTGGVEGLGTRLGQDNMANLGLATERSWLALGGTPLHEWA